MRVRAEMRGCGAPIVVGLLYGVEAGFQNCSSSKIIVGERLIAVEASVDRIFLATDLVACFATNHLAIILLIFGMDIRLPVRAPSVVSSWPIGRRHHSHLRLMLFTVLPELNIEFFCENNDL